jgi:hypothetical protein
MRETFDWIDDATENNERLRAAFYDMAAQLIATQAFAVACATRTTISEVIAAKLVEDVAGYSGVTGRTMTKDSKIIVGKRAIEMLMMLARMKPGFVV